MDESRAINHQIMDYEQKEGVGEEANELTPDRRELPCWSPWPRTVRWRARGRAFEGNGVGGSGGEEEESVFEFPGRYRLGGFIVAGGRFQIWALSVRALQEMGRKQWN